MEKNNKLTASTKLVVESYAKQYVQLENKSVSAMLDLMSEDIEWDIPGDENIAPWVGKRQGKEALRKFFDVQKQYFIPLNVEINQIMIDQEHGVLIGYIAIKINATAKTFNSPFMAHLIVENDKISKFLFLEDSQALVEAMTM